MIERKNIDRVFQENLKDLDINPSKKVWNNIELHLAEKPEKKPMVLWQRMSGIAMAVMFLLASGFWYNSLNSVTSGNNDDNVSEINSTSPVNNEIIPINQVVENKQKIFVQNDRIKNNGVALKKETPVFVKKPNNNVIVTTRDIKTIYESIENKYIVNESDFLQSLKSNENTITNFDVVNIEEEKLTSRQKKWSIGPTIAPVYYNTLGKGSPIDNNLANNSKASESAISVGVKLNYQLTNKINLQSGINKVELAYITKNVGAVITSAKTSSNNINPKNSGFVLTNSGNQVDGTQSSLSRNKSTLNGDLNQTIEYFELPIEMKYNIYESRFGIGLVGGFSTFILTNNSVTMISQNQIIELGKANNLNSINFSGNLGFDFDYKINSNWYLNVAPIFKYQFNTYSNNSGNFQPYYFGVYSGLNYRF